MRIADVVKDLETIAPPRLADGGDKIGLQVGDSSVVVSRIAVAVDPTRSTIDLAIAGGADLLVCHHPLIYRPLEALASGEPVADNVTKLIKSDTALYVMHTNYDAAAGGVNDVLAEMLGVKVTGLIAIHKQERLQKLAVFVPKEALDRVTDAMAEAGAGFIGDYSNCSFRVEGTGTFRPLQGANPYIGRIGELEETPEYRLEMIVPEWKLSNVVDAMLSAHPYEEVAYDVYALENGARKFGFGRVGRLKKALKLSEFRDTVESVLGSKTIRMVGDAEKTVQTVALCSGAGKSFISEAHAAGADVYVTADVGYHDFVAAESIGLAVIDAGHYETECPAMKSLQKRLSTLYAGKNIAIDFIDQNQNKGRQLV